MISKDRVNHEIKRMCIYSIDCVALRALASDQCINTMRGHNHDRLFYTLPVSFTAAVL